MKGPQCQIIYLELQPGNHRSVRPRQKTALQLLHSLDLAEETALVIRDGKLLTPDRQICAGDAICVCMTGSRG